jgi:hypothetical protein
LVKTGEIESVSNNDRGHPSTPVCEWHVNAIDDQIEDAGTRRECLFNF